MTKLVSMDHDLRPYLAALMVAALHRAKDKLVIPDDLELVKVTREQFDHMLQTEAGKTYDADGAWSAGPPAATQHDNE